MKKSLTLILLSFLATFCFSQQTNYWQQEVNYKIDVTLNDKGKTLDGFVKIQYHNNSNDTLHFIWFHLWPNAYKNDKTAFSDQLLENGNTDFYFSPEEKRGYINRLDFKVNGISATTADHLQHQDIIKLILPAPLPPKQVADIQTPFHVKLPYLFSRSGYNGNAYQVTQWYPKPAVYDKKGWHEMPYLDQGEFYSEFGRFDVQVTVPEKYQVAATGKVLEEKKQTGQKTIRFVENNVHDFAWFADSAFMVKHDTMQLASGVIDVYAYHYRENEKGWKKSLAFIKSAIRTKSEWLGVYPYQSVSVVESKQEGAGGMEYPGITVISSPGNEKMLDYIINHEVGHNWFYGILASNERLHPWMDEGMNSYYDRKYNALQYKDSTADYLDVNSSFIRKRLPADFEDVLLGTMTRLKKDQPIETNAAAFSELNYNAIAYTKSARWMKILENETGGQVFSSIMKEYYSRWKFKHPYPEDFKSVAEEVSGKNLDNIFSLLTKKGSLTKEPSKKIKLASFFSLRETNKYKYIFFSPAVGFNNYDRFMAGGIIHNHTLPASRFRFTIAPLYATGSKKLNGIGKLAYNWFPGNNGQRLELSVSAANFSGDTFTDTTGKINYLRFSKIVPSLKFVFANRNPRSTANTYLQWKTFFITETTLNFYRDTVQQLDIITYPVANRYVNQLTFVTENNRLLYPYRAALQAEQGKGFLRFNFTGNYFFNYPAGGGLDARFFAGKFIYTGDQTYLTQFETDRYHLNMTGPKGYEDYTYSNYFIGRNDFRYALYNPNISLLKNISRGMPGQQIMERDGFFKVRTDLLSSKIGKTDDWLCAINLSTTIPKKINPLELLPFKIPLKVFADIGTYAEAWDKNAGGSRFLYDAGLQLSLLKNSINIFFPILYSKVYVDYFKSTITEKRFLKNISFSIDIQHITLQKLVPQSPL